MGDIEHSGLFRPVEVDESRPIGLPALLGPSALNNLEALKACVGPSQYDTQLRSCCLDEVALGRAEGPFDRAQMDERFGPGGWRPLERFTLFQSDKYRPIDSGKKPGHDSASLERETIFTSSVDAFLPIIQETLRYLQPLESFFPGIGRFVLGAEDMKHAYRQSPVRPSNLCVTCAAFWGTLKPKTTASSFCRACPSVCLLLFFVSTEHRLSSQPCVEERWLLPFFSSLTIPGCATLHLPEPQPKLGCASAFSLRGLSLTKPNPNLLPIAVLTLDFQSTWPRFHCQANSALISSLGFVKVCRMTFKPSSKRAAWVAAAHPNFVVSLSDWHLWPMWACRFGPVGL